jgi:hypothetical protein
VAVLENCAILHSLAERRILKILPPAKIQPTCWAADRGSVDDLRYPIWQKLYEEAISETIQPALVVRIKAAKAAVVSRMKDMRITSETHAEALALESALRILAGLGNEKAKSKTSQKATGFGTQLDSQLD